MIDIFDPRGLFPSLRSELSHHDSRQLTERFQIWFVIAHKSLPDSTVRIFEHPAGMNLLRFISPNDEIKIHGYSHSIVAGGLEVTSRTTRLTSGTELVIRVEMRAKTS